jgi:hypothetical protein
MGAVAQKKKPRLFHASMLVTRLEEWCVEAESAKEARALLASGNGHRCHLGDCLHVEVEQFEEQ